MGKGRTNRMVVDTSVFQAAGDREAPSSRSCTNFLMQMYLVCHKAVVSRTLREEWKRHLTRFSGKWWSQMKGRKKVWEPAVTDATITEQQAAALGMHQREVRALMDDSHLVEAALASDGYVVSLDEEARGLWRRVAEVRKSLRKIAWINPAIMSLEDANDWLSGGAPKQAHWLRH